MGVKRKENRRHRHRASRRKSSRPHKNGRKGTFFLSNAPALRDFWLLSHGYGGGNAFLSIYFIAFHESRGMGAKCKHDFAQYYEYIEPVELQLSSTFSLQPRLVPIPRGRFRIAVSSSKVYKTRRPGSEMAIQHSSIHLTLSNNRKTFVIARESHQSRQAGKKRYWICSKDQDDHPLKAPRSRKTS